MCQTVNVAWAVPLVEELNFSPIHLVGEGVLFDGNITQFHSGKRNQAVTAPTPFQQRLRELEVSPYSKVNAITILEERLLCWRI